MSYESTRCGDIAIFVTVDLFWANLDHAQSVSSGLYHCEKFVWDRCSGFNDMQACNRLSSITITPKSHILAQVRVT